jgi:hypothetical protein
MTRGDAQHVLRRAVVSNIFDVGQCDRAMLEPDRWFWGAMAKLTLAVKGKALIHWRSGVESGEYAGRTIRGCGWEQGWASKAWEESAELWHASRLVWT